MPDCWYYVDNMKKTIKKAFTVLIIAVSMLLVVSCATNAAQDPDKALNLWTENAPLKTALVEFVQNATDKSNPGYIPVERRIAVFDMDGTILCETDRDYFDHTLLAYRVTEDPSYIYRASEFEKDVANQIIEKSKTSSPVSGLDIDHGKAVATAFKGMTPDRFIDYIQVFKELPMPGYEGMKRGDSFYLPMIQVIDYLQANDFTVYIVSGTDRLISRAIFYNNDAFNLQPKQIIGSDVLLVATNQGTTDGLQYTYTDKDQVVIGGQFLIKNLKMNKVTAIVREIGYQPVLSFGNTTGDAAMAMYTITNNPYPSLAFMLCCDDLVRENGNQQKADDMYSLCRQLNWIPVSMKIDWTTIYGDGVKRK